MTTGKLDLVGLSNVDQTTVERALDRVQQRDDDSA
jgi:hypothetical protein